MIISAGSCPLQQGATHRLALAPLNWLIFGKAVPEPPGGWVVQKAQGAPSLCAFQSLPNLANW
jgi:hypothetical protein